MRLHVMVSILLCGLVNFLYGSDKTQPQIYSNYTKIAYAVNINTEREKNLRRQINFSQRFTLNEFVVLQEPHKVVVSREDDSDFESNGRTASPATSLATSPATSPQPPKVLDPNLDHDISILSEMSRTESFPDLKNRSKLLSASGSSLEELGSPWNNKSGSGFVDGHPIKTPPKGQQDCPVPTPKKDDDCIENHRVSTPAR